MKKGLTYITLDVDDEEFTPENVWSITKRPKEVRYDELIIGDKYLTENDGEEFILINIDGEGGNGKDYTFENAITKRTRTAMATEAVIKQNKLTGFYKRVFHRIGYSTYNYDTSKYVNINDIGYIWDYTQQKY